MTVITCPNCGEVVSTEGKFDDTKKWRVICLSCGTAFELSEGNKKEVEDGGA